MRSLNMRIASMMLACALIIPSLFIIAEAQHDCPGDGCEICHVLADAIAATHTGADIPTHTAQIAPIFTLALLCVVQCNRTTAKTLVGLKVRLDC